MSEGSERSTRIGWTVSSYSGAQGECVECNQHAEGQVLLRDTKHRDHGMLAFSDQEWAGFLGTVAAK